MKSFFPALRIHAALLFFSMFISSAANAGHLFTQASANTPIALNSGQGINVTQLTYEGAGTNGRVLMYFSGGGASTAWSAGDAVQITISGWTETFQYDTLVGAGGTQSGTQFDITSSTLAAANITTSGAATWSIVATSGQFTWEGYRIYVVNGTYDGTGADTITQSQVVNASGFASVANPNEKSVGSTLDGLSGATGQMGDVLTVLNALTDDSKRTAMQLISPNQSQVMEQSSIDTATSALDTVELRLDALRVGMGLGGNIVNNDTGMSSGDEAYKRAFWLKGFGGYADQDGRNGFAGSNSKMYGMMGGADRVTESDWLLGAALAYARTNVDMGDLRAGDDAGIDTYQVTGYVGKNFERWYLQGMLTYAYQNYETNRNTHLTGIATGDFNGDMYGMRVVAGLPLKLSGGATITPTIGLEALHISQDSYAEEGAGALSLNVASSDANRLRSLIGVELAKLVALNDGSLLRPSLKASWRHEFNTDGVNTLSTFIGGGAQFETVGQSVNSNIQGLAARLNWEKTDQFGMAVELGAERSTGYFGLNGQLTATYRF